VKLVFACIPGHSRIDTPSGPREVTRLEPGDWVTGYSGRTVQILQKHSYLENPATVFLRITFADGAALELCSMHRIAGIRAGHIRRGQIIAGRRVTGIEVRQNISRSFDLLTEDTGYRTSGIPVNSMIEEMQAAAVSGLRFVQDRPASE
jgi:hypothetical protein